MALTSNWTLEINAVHAQTAEDRDILVQINREEAQQLAPVIVYIIVLLVIGIVGNPLAVYIYGWKWPDNSTRIFLLYLAGIDFINCIVTMPTEIYVMLNFYYFRNAFICCTSRFFTYTYNNSTTVIFLVIAFDRYVRICHPYRQTISVAGSKMACFVSLCVAIAVSWPALFLYGNKYISLHYTNELNDTIKGVICDVRNSMDSTSYPILYFIYLWCGFASSLSILSVLYICIGRVILRRKQKRSHQTSVVQSDIIIRQAATAPLQNNEEVCTTSRKSNDKDVISKKQKKISSKLSNIKQDENAEVTSPTTGKKLSQKFSNKLVVLSPKRHSIIRGPGSTFMLFTLTAVFMVTFLPFLIIMTIRLYSGPDFYPSLSPATQILTNLFSRSYLVNSCANPIVYGLCNSRFRQEVYKLFRWNTQKGSKSLSQLETGM